MSDSWQRLVAALDGTEVAPHAEALAASAAEAMARARHGDLPRWRRALDALPRCSGPVSLDQAAPSLGAPVDDPHGLRELLMVLHPWRKGPLCLGGVAIDTEWRSDWKWDRLAPHVDLAGDTVLDVGCGNGYFGLRMLGAGARCVVGVDPTLVFVMQWLAQVHFAPQLDNYVLPLRDVDLPGELGGFGSVFSMGVLYHRRDPSEHIARLAGWLRPGGTLVLETLVLDQPGDGCLVPKDRYARMRNVWHVPTVNRLLDELSQGPFTSVRAVDVSATTTREQRSTEWMSFDSLEQSLDPKQPGYTVEGYPAPVRAMVIATREGA